MRTSKLVKLLIAVVVLSCAPFSANGQTTPDVMEGLTPYQSFQGGNFDSINLSNGNVLLRIPLIDYPQRGGILKLGFTFVDNSKEASAGEECFPETGCEDIWYSYTAHVGSVPTVFNQVVDDKLALTVQSTFYIGANEFADYGVVTSDGAIHPLVQNGTETSDATGFYANPSGADDLTQPTLAMNRNGIRFTLTENTNNTFTREDPNGNQIFAPTYGFSYLSGGIFKDTVGRSIPAPPGTATSNFSKCPTGGLLLPIASATVWTVPGPAGSNPESFTFCNVTVNLNIPNNEPSPVKGTSSALTLTQSIVLPNGTAWTFEYNDRNPGDPSSVNYGIPTEIILPTGGTITYTFTTNASGNASPSWSRWITSRTVNANDGTGSHTWTYGYAGIGGTAPTTTVTDPLGNNTIHTFGLFGTSGYFETKTQYYQLINGTQTLLKTVTENYTSLNDGNAEYQIAGVVPKSVTTTWPNNNQVSQTQTDYDSQSSGTWSYGNVIAKREYDYGTGAPGALLRTTTTQYEAFISSPYLTNNLLDLPSSIQVTDGGGTQRGLTTYGYDAYALQSSGLGAAQQLDTSPADGTQRGNRTSVSRWLNGSAIATTNCGVSVTNGNLINYYTYNNSGTVYNSTDPCGSSAGDSKHTTSYAYSSTYEGAYLTTVTNPIGQSTTYTYDSGTGLVASVKDPNSQTTSYTYDNMWRIHTVTFPDNGLDTITHQESTYPFSATLTKAITTSPALNYVLTNVFDGVGRVSQTEVQSDPAGTDRTVTTYDGDGRKYEVYNATRCSSPTTNCGDPTWGYSIYSYDGLNRTTQVVEQDGSKVMTSYSGNSATVTDEASKTRESFTDGLGRMTEVIENPGGLGYTTNYAYDALNDLTSVVEASSRNRSFVYDSLSRLTSATNPESGTTSYIYDADGNVLTKEDARSITATSTYDTLNRLTKRTYTDGTPTLNFLYDISAGWVGISQTNLVGRLSEQWTGVGGAGSSEAIFGYDPVGRIALNDQCTPLNCGTSIYPIGYTYDLNGDMTTYTNGEGVTLTQAFNGAAQAQVLTSSLSDAQHPSTLASIGQFFPSGAPELLNCGNNRQQLHFLNNRLQPCRLDVTTNAAYPVSLTSCSANSNYSTLQTFLLEYNEGSSDNGNVAYFAGAYGQVFARTLTYDQLNRLNGMSDADTAATCQGASWTYDTWGNRLTQTPTKGSCTMWSQAYDSTNRITGWAYDAAGNLLNDGSHSYTYDAENRIKQVDGGSTATYAYDAKGRRVEKQAGGATTDYVYNLAGQVVAEQQPGVWSVGYAYLGDMLMSQYANGTTYFIHLDHLGSARVMTTVAGAVLDSMDYMPFGEQILGGTDTTHKFTGKERDAESNLDNFGARYNSSAMGRFMTPDPAGVLAVALKNPQTWNSYAYTMNNPLRYTDPTGKYLCADSTKCDSFQDRAFEAARQRDLKSEDKATVAAAKAYGDPNTDNHVGVSFVGGDKGFTNLSVNWNGKTVTSSITVQIPGSHVGTALDEDVGHEGTHVGQDQALAASFKPDGSFNGGLNLTTYDAEFSAYHVNAAIIQASGDPRSLDPARNYMIKPGDTAGQISETINRFLADPASGYGVSLQNPGPRIIQRQGDSSQ